jgi:hypothetical protein
MKENYCVICGRIISSKCSTKYCKKHHFQLQKYGKVLDNNPRTKFDPNEFRFIGNDIVEFDTYDVSGNVVATYKIDAEDYPLVSKYKWRTIKGYASYGAKIHYLHRLITNAKDGQQVDHINLDITDNRKCNLRFADNSLNQSNKRGYNKFNIKGIEYHKSINKWSAYFRIDNKQYHSPCYSTKEEATFARFILEQMFRKESLTQFSENLINILDIAQKENIIQGLKNKFNK